MENLKSLIKENYSIEEAKHIIEQMIINYEEFIKDENFFLILKKILNTHSLDNLESIPVKDKVISFYRFLEVLPTFVMRSVFNKEKLEGDYVNGKEELFNTLLKSYKHNLLNNEILDWFFDKYKISNESNSINEILNNTTSFKNLYYLEIKGINVWKSYKKSENIETLLPVHVISLNNTKGKINRESLENIIEFFSKNKEKWINYNTEKTSSKEFKTRLALRFSSVKSESKFRKILKTLDITDKDIITCNDIVKGIEVSSQNILLKNFKLQTLNKMLEKDKLNIKDESFLFDLLNTTPSTSHEANLKTNKKAFEKIFERIVANIDFKKRKDNKSILDRYFDSCENSNINCYLPIILGPYSGFNYSFIASDTIRSQSIQNFIQFCYMKEMDFYEKSNETYPVVRALDILINHTNISDSIKAFRVFYIDILKNIPKNKEMDIWEEIFKNFENLLLKNNDNPLDSIRHILLHIFSLEYNHQEFPSTYIKNKEIIFENISRAKISDLFFLESKDLLPQLTSQYLKYSLHNKKILNKVKKI